MESIPPKEEGQNLSTLPEENNGDKKEDVKEE
jgi:hypothetical protein